ncbi:MAG TPA: peptidoglycan DD-metalloendopeptidase family protein [Arenimonas sp.]|nr:peptidoglycan DD-metalloendopeptidase family protein [Arenimonas sp.]
MKTAVATGMLALLLAAPLWAQSASERKQQEAAAQQRLEALRTQLRELGADQQRIDAERGEATTALREADRAVGEAGRALRQTEAGIATQEVELQRLQAQQVTLEQSLGQQREALAALVRSAYALGRHEQLKLLLAQDRLADLARVLAYHRYFQNDRQQRIAGLLGELQALADLAAEVLAQKQALDAARQQQQDELAALEQQRGQRQELLGELDRRLRDQKARVQALGRDEKAVLALLERLRDAIADIPRQVEDNRPFASRRGQLGRPLAGQQLTGYGARLPDGRQSDGLLIAGTAGAEVRATAPGRVAFADWLKGYGLLLILDHGDGWMSLYAHNDALLKDVGDWVRGGEALATVGSSGGLGRPALYFELRQNGQPQNPRPWLKP